MDIEKKTRKNTPERLKALNNLEKYYSKQIAALGADNSERSYDIIKMVKTVLGINGEVYSEEKIASAMEEVSRLKSYVKMSDNEAAGKVLSRLKNKGSDKRPGAKPNTGLIEDFNRNGLTIRNN